MTNKYNKNAPQTVQAMFSTIAKSYDRTNAIVSFQLHRYWNRQLIKVVTKKNPSAYLDLCSGTGEIALNYLKKAQSPCQAYLLDFCNEMLECAKVKAQVLAFEHNHQIAYLNADAQSIPLNSESVECVTIAYGIRNVKSPENCLREAARVLKPGGCIGILELTRPKNRFLRWGHRLYLKCMLPTLGKYFAANRDAYHYLCNSINHFVDPNVLEDILKSEGFSDIKQIPLNGGIATIIIAEKKIIFGFHHSNPKAESREPL